MIKSINYWSLPGGLEENLEPKKAINIAKSYGFNAIELVLGEKYININSKRESIKKYKEYSRKTDLKISSLASSLFWKYHFSSNSNRKIEKAKDLVKKMLEVADWLEIDAIMIMPGFVENILYKDEPIIPYDVVYERSLEALIELKKNAEDLKINICLENVWNKFLLSPLEMRDFIDKINSPFVGAYLDVGNVVIYGYPEHWIEILKKRIKRVHLKDFKRRVGTIDGFCLLLEGDVNYPLVIKTLKNINYNSFLTAEIIPSSQEIIYLTSQAMDLILKM